MGEIPKDRCGFVSAEGLLEDLGGVCCWRPIWKKDACIWHAKVKEKPTQKLLESRSKHAERLDYSYVPSTNLRNISFESCSLYQSVFRESELVEVSFKNAEVRLSDFEGATLHKADLTEANFSLTNISGADLTFSEIYSTNFKNSNLTGAAMAFSSISHSEFFSANLSKVDMQETYIHQSDFFDVDLRETELTASEITKSNFKRSNLEESNIYRADIANCNLIEADLTKAVARGTTFDKSNFEDAIFDRTELRDANLRNARLYQTLFSDTRINSNTDFGEQSAYEDPDTELGEQYDDTSRWEAAAWVYRRLQDLHEENAMSEQAQKYHVQKEEAHRRDYWEKGQYFQWGVYTLNRYLTNHGESLKHVVWWSIGIIVACGLLYPFTGGMETANGVERATSASNLSFGLFAQSFYYSMVTFTTLGYGNPAGTGAKLLVGLESLAGTLLIALFVFVLGRRVAR